MFVDESSFTHKPGADCILLLWVSPSFMRIVFLVRFEDLEDTCTRNHPPFPPPCTAGALWVTGALNVDGKH